MKTMNDYMEMSYRMEIIEDKEEGGFVVSYPDLPGCVTCGETVESAVATRWTQKRRGLKRRSKMGFRFTSRMIWKLTPANLS